MSSIDNETKGSMDDLLSNMDENANQTILNLSAENRVRLIKRFPFLKSGDEGTHSIDFELLKVEVLLRDLQEGERLDSRINVLDREAERICRKYEQKLKELEGEISACKRNARTALIPEERKAAEKTIDDLLEKRNVTRQDYMEGVESIEQRKTACLKKAEEEHNWTLEQKILNMLKK